MIRVFLICALWALPLAAQDASQAAQAAARALEEASAALNASERARDRVASLTQTVHAFEDGLAAMRVGLRQVAIRETELARKLQSQEQDVSRLLGALLALGGNATPQTLLHPQGPLATARAGMLLADVTPGLSSEVDALRADLEEAETLRALQQNALRTVQDGLAGVQQARTDLSQAIASRTDLPRRFVEDPVQIASLIAATETLQGFASGLARVNTGSSDALPGLEWQKGDLALPVRGRVLRLAGEPDAAGVTRPGIVVATEPKALVTTPVAATILYNGPLLDYGLVSILEPQAGVMFVFAGLDALFGAAGDVLPEGTPLGLMGGENPDELAPLSPIVERTGVSRSETLYIEVREGDAPTDPLAWFATDRG